MSSKCKVSIFTPTYNRSHTLERLYESIVNQTDKDFEWIIVDDGSEDNTELLVRQWIGIKEINIVYKKVNNGGKHRAINNGIDMANGELFFIVDSDDILTEDSIEKIKKWESTIADKENFAGIAGLKGYNENKSIGTTFKGEYFDCTSLERDKYNIKGDKAEVFYTRVLRRNKFPEFEGEKFITESTIWYKIANLGLKIRWFNEVIYIAEYRNDGLTNQGDTLFLRNPKGALYSYKLESKYKDFSFKRRMYAINRYIYIAESIGMDFKDMAFDLHVNRVFLRVIRRLYKLKEERKI